MHGVRLSLLEQQASAIGIPLNILQIPEQASMPVYNQIMTETVQSLKADGFSSAFFGDIFLQDLRQYREQQLKPFGIEAHFPLWGRDTKKLLSTFLDLGFKTMVVCVKASVLDSSFVGQVIDQHWINELPKTVDPCGENGEFHTFVFDGPIFQKPITLSKGEIVYREYNAPKSSGQEEGDQDQCFSKPQTTQMGFWFCDLLPKTQEE
jgi:uncharacterized protein (TIGR00290 family)